MSTRDTTDNGRRPGGAPLVVAQWPARVAPEETPPRATLHGDLTQMGARPMNGLLYLGVLAVAAGIDIATFYQVLALVMRNVPDEVVWLGVVGFTTTALTLAHTIGVRMRMRADGGDRAISSGSAWLCFVVWLFVGLTAFTVRLVADPTTSSGGTTIVEDGQPLLAPAAGADNPMLAALLFLALYLATGTVAGIAGYLRHNTAARAYRSSLRSRASAARTAARTVADLTLAQQTKAALDQERERRIDGWQKAQEEWAAIARRLKQEARLRLAAAAQDPSTTDAYFLRPASVPNPAAWANHGANGNGTAHNGASPHGATHNGASPHGATHNGATYHGAAHHATAHHGTSYHGGTGHPDMTPGPATRTGDESRRDWAP